MVAPVSKGKCKLIGWVYVGNRIWYSLKRLSTEWIIARGEWLAGWIWTSKWINPGVTVVIESHLLIHKTSPISLPEPQKGKGTWVLTHHQNPGAPSKSQAQTWAEGRRRPAWLQTENLLPSIPDVTSNKKQEPEHVIFSLADLVASGSQKWPNTIL